MRSGNVKRFSGKAPRRGIFVVEGDGDTAFWTRIGAVWTRQDGQGFNLSLAAVPFGPAGSAPEQGMREMIPASLREKLLANGREYRCREHHPSLSVVKVFTPDAYATCLLTEIDRHEPDRPTLCDLGVGAPELGYVSLSEMVTVRGPFGLPIELDQHFLARKPLSEYAQDARVLGRIVT